MAKKPNLKDVDNFELVFGKLTKAIDELKIDVHAEVGKYIKERIVAKARQGITAAYKGQEQPMKPLSEEYIEFRESIANGVDKGAKRIKKDSKVSMKSARALAKKQVVDEDFFSPKKSNLTLTGQYLKSIEVTAVDKEKGEIVIGPNDSTRKSGPGFVKGKKSKALTNKTLSGYLKKMGRSIFGLDETGRKVVLNMLKRKVRDEIRKKILSK